MPAPSIRPKRIEDHFATGEEFEQHLLQAIEDCPDRNAAAMDFLIDLKGKWEKYGMRCNLSDNQYNWLMRLAGESD